MITRFASAARGLSLLALFALAATAACSSNSPSCNCAAYGLELVINDKTTGARVTNVTITDSGAGLAVGPQYCPAPDGGSFGADGGLLLCPDWKFTTCGAGETAGCIGAGATSISITAPGYQTVSFNITTSATTDGCACQMLTGSNTTDVQASTETLADGGPTGIVIETVLMSH